MKKILILCTALFLASCADTKFGQFVASVESAATGTVSPAAIYIARNSFDAIEVSATNYLLLKKCPINAPFCRDAGATAKLIPAIRSGRVARNNATQFLIDHPNQLGTQGLYEALTTATSTIQTILTQYNIGN